MKNTLETKIVTCKAKNESKLGSFIKRKADRLNQYQFTCPFCREVVNGISAMGAHLKDHCT
jgi:hypothetical protein